VRLRRLTGGQVDAVILAAGLPREHIRGEPATAAQRAVDIVQLAVQGGDSVGQRLAEAVDRELAWST
jgi:hypothetical protein